MTIHNLVEKIGLEVYSGGKGLDNEISTGYCSDLLSDVMGNSKEGDLWITLQTHKNVMAVASLKDLSAILLVNNLKANADTLEASNEENIPILGTSLSAFEICGKIYSLLKP
ncbi:MAG: serine kinase [Bacteroidales bacterium]|nr:serine kinase [Bacteroidales bacterium]